MFQQKKQHAQPRAPVPFKVGITVNDHAGVLAGHFKQMLVGCQTAESETGRTGLVNAEDFAFARAAVDEARGCNEGLWRDVALLPGDLEDGFLPSYAGYYG